MSALERPEIGEDPRFSSREGRIQNYIALRDTLAVEFAKRTRAEWAERLEAQDVPYAPVYGIDDVIADPQVQHLGTFYQLAHPSEGEVWGVQPPLFFDGARPGAMTPPPVLGENSDEVLGELGLEPERIAELRAKSVI